MQTEKVSGKKPLNIGSFINSFDPPITAAHFKKSMTTVAAATVTPKQR